MKRNYFKTTFRSLWRNRGFSAINIVGLSAGLSCCMLNLLYAMDEVSYDCFHVNAANIYQLVVDNRSSDGLIHKFSGTGDIPGPSFIRDIRRFVYMEPVIQLDWTARCSIKLPF